MAAAAFSDDGVVAASEKLVPIMADFSNRQAGPQELKKKYGVTGYPTVVFTDHTGKEIEKLRGRNAATVKAQIEDIAAKHTVEIFIEAAIEEAKGVAKERSKPLMLVLLTDDKAKSQPKNAALQAALMDASLEPLRERCLLVKRPLRDGKKVTPEAKAHGASKSPTLLVIDPASEEEGKGAVLKKITKPKGLAKTLAKLLKKVSKD